MSGLSTHAAPVEFHAQETHTEKLIKQQLAVTSMEEHALFRYCRDLIPGHFRTKEGNIIIAVEGPQSEKLRLLSTTGSDRLILRPDPDPEWPAREDDGEVIHYDRGTGAVNYSRLKNNVRSLLAHKAVINMRASIRAPPPYPDQLETVLVGTLEGLKQAHRYDFVKKKRLPNKFIYE